MTSRALPAIWLVAVLYSCGTTVADPDLWGHTLYGIRAVEQGVLVERTDPFSYTAAGARWVNHEWLTEYQFGRLWLSFGESGLWAWRTLLVMGLFAVGVVAIARARANLGASLLLLLFTAECLSGYCLFIRPQIATFMLFALTLFVLHSAWQRPTGWIWLLPLATCLWTNLHGGFLAGLALQTLYLVGFGIRGLRDRCQLATFWKMATVAGLSLLATVINPYGLTLHKMLWIHLIPAQAVREWQPIWVMGQNINFYLPVVLLGLTLPAWR